MTKDDIIRLAIEHTISGLKFDEEGLLRFAKLVAEHEREACAKLCDELDQKLWEDMGESMSGYGDAIRERT
jgi:hypothetical protein